MDGHYAQLQNPSRRRAGRSSAQVALNWLRAKPGVIPLIGARPLRQLEDNLGCLDFELDAQTVAPLDKVRAPPAIHPHRCLSFVPNILHAGFDKQRDVHRVRLHGPFSNVALQAVLS